MNDICYMQMWLANGGPAEFEVVFKIREDIRTRVLDWVSDCREDFFIGKLNPKKVIEMEGLRSVVDAELFSKLESERKLNVTSPDIQRSDRVVVDHTRYMLVMVANAIMDFRRRHIKEMPYVNPRQLPVWEELTDCGYKDISTPIQQKNRNIALRLKGRDFTVSLEGQCRRVDNDRPSKIGPMHSSQEEALRYMIASVLNLKFMR